MEMHAVDHKQKVRFKTLGCRLNQYETQAIREQFQKAGFEEVQRDHGADLLILNTCTVTGESDRESRYLIRKFHRENPEARIVVTGCYVERNENEVKNLPGVSLTVLNRQKSDLVRLLDSCTSLSLSPVELPSRRTYTPLSISQFEGRSRAYVKIQDGCNHACSFCKVVLVRGPARSRPMEEVIDEVKRLTDHGFREVVLTGIQLGSYGFDFEKRSLLAKLLERLAEIPDLGRIRLSSIEPTDVTDELIEAMASHPEKVCSHLHIPLQSGDDRVLARMNRRYRRSFYRNLVSKIRECVDDFVLTTDVMIGFPGEIDESFQETVEVLLETKPYKLHIFPYSVREGTWAARFGEGVTAQEMTRRRGALLALEAKLRRQVQEKFLGRDLEVLVEKTRRKMGWATARAANYLKVRFPAGAVEEGKFVKVRIEEIEGEHLLGKLIQNERTEHVLGGISGAR